MNRRLPRRPEVRSGNATRVVTAMAPALWLVAGDAVNSGGNMGAGNNRGSLGGTFAPSAGTIAFPAAGSGFASPVATLTGTQSIDWSGAASSLKFLHDGTGCWGYNVYALTTNTQDAAIMVTCDLNTFQTGIAVYTLTGTGTCSAAIRNGTANIANRSAATAAAGTPRVRGFSYAEGRANEVRVTTGATVDSQGDTGAAPDTGNPLATLRIGGSAGGGGFFAQMLWAETILFNRLPAAGEEASYLAYVLSRYGF